MNRQPCFGMAAMVALVLALPSGAMPRAPGEARALPDAGLTPAAARPGTILRPPPRPSDVYVCLPAGPDGVAECWRP